ncbi:MAG: hypothetical protein AB7O21_20325 [Gammaproteobacteria bacterium]
MPWLCQSCTGQAAEPIAASASLEAQRPTPVVGYRVSYEGRQMGYHCADWIVARIEDTGDVISSCGDYELKLSAAYDFNPVSLVTRDGRALMEFFPYAPTIRFPLKVDQRWHGQYRMKAPDLGIDADVRAACRVASYEEIEIPAGRLPAFRIDCVDRLQMGPREMRTHTTRWYAPEAAAFVKSEQLEDPANWDFVVTHFGMGSPDIQAAGPAPSASPPPPVNGADLDALAPVLDPDAY